MPRASCSFHCRLLSARLHVIFTILRLKNLASIWNFTFTAPISIFLDCQTQLKADQFLFYIVRLNSVYFRLVYLSKKSTFCSDRSNFPLLSWPLFPSRGSFPWWSFSAFHLLHWGLKWAPHEHPTSSSNLRSSLQFYRTFFENWFLDHWSRADLLSPLEW